MLLVEDIFLLFPPLVWGADGKTYNINADTVAAKIAGALKAETMVAMTNIDGVLRDVHDPDLSSLKLPW